MHKPFNVIIIDSDAEARSRLKQAARALGIFGDLYPVQNFAEAAPQLDQVRRWDIVFVSYRFPSVDVLQFVEQCRESKPGGKDCAYIKVLKGEDQMNSEIATNIAKGVDGFLCEPYSADALKQSAETAIKVKLKSGKIRFKMALRMMLPVLINAIDRTRCAPGSDYRTTPEYKEISTTCRELKQLSDQAETGYEAMVNEVFAELQESSKAASYSGASKRVRDRLAVETQLRDTLRDELLNIQ